MPPAAPQQSPEPRRRWVLRPGTMVLRRDATTVQVGLDPPHRTLMAESATTRHLLGELRYGRLAPASDDPVRRDWCRLESAGLLVPDEPGPAGVDPTTLSATRAWAGADGARRLRARGRLRIGISGPGDLTRGLHRLLQAGAMVVVGSDEVDLLVKFARGELARAESDALVAAGQPHLVVGSSGGLPRLGPLVVPGLTACLRCVDAHESESDPRRPLLLEQAAALGAGPGAEQHQPCDPVLGALSTGLLARDLQRYAEGEQPLSWSSTVLVGPGELPTVTTWTRHPHCGCAWDVALAG